jgi:hypothetical protein
MVYNKGLLEFFFGGGTLSVVPYSKERNVSETGSISIFRRRNGLSTPSSEDVNRSSFRNAAFVGLPYDGQSPKTR